MDKEEKDVPFENTPNQRMFALAIISEKVGENQEKTELKTKSRGMSLPEAIFWIEAWLESMKEKLKKPFKDSINFGP